MNVPVVYRSGSSVLALPAFAGAAQFCVIAGEACTEIGCESTRTARAFWHERFIAVFARALVRKGQSWN
jgi:hypothetical protein